VPKIRKKGLETIGTRVDRVIRQKLEMIAESEERSVSALVRMAIREFIERKLAAKDKMPCPNPF
jgi:predicted transcriptional regulator